MTTTPLAKLVNKKLRKNGYDFTAKRIQHAVQFRFETGAILNLFDTGTVFWQGDYERRDDRIELLIAAAKRATRKPGLFDR
jgi:hypothetical protein